MDSLQDQPGPEANANDIGDDRRKTPDRRRASRRKVLKVGRAFWPNADSSECLVHNLSEEGAQLQLRGFVPNVFDLLIEGDPWRRPCSVVWRNANRVGVRFQEERRLAPQREGRKNQLDEYRRFAEECRKMAERTVSSDRELLLAMAAAWLVVVRQLRRKDLPRPAQN
jgi:hypothetical protein